MKRFVSILLFALPLMAMAQTQTSVTLEAAGQLSEKIAEADRFKIAELKISGPMNGADIKLMQEALLDLIISFDPLKTCYSFRLSIKL